jgi:DNA-binding GntR family transcriptional regulator
VPLERPQPNDDGATRLAPLTVANLPERIADRLIEAIARRELSPGQHLIETQLSEQLSISRAPLREALRVLQSQGIVTALPRRGVRLIAFDKTWARELYHIRVALERVCSHASAAHLRTNSAARKLLDDAVIAIENAGREGDIFDINTADLALHATIYDLSGSPLLQTLWQAIARHVLVLFSIETYRYQDPARIIQEHHDLRHVLLEGTPREIDEEVARHVAGQHYLSDEEAPNLPTPPTGVIA